MVRATKLGVASLAFAHMEYTFTSPSIYVRMGAAAAGSGDAAITSSRAFMHC